MEDKAGKKAKEAQADEIFEGGSIEEKPPSADCMLYVRRFCGRGQTFRMSDDNSLFVSAEIFYLC